MYVAHLDRLWSVSGAAGWQTAVHDMTVHSKQTQHCKQCTTELTTGHIM